MTSDSGQTIFQYHRGEWTSIPDPIGWDGDGDYEDVIHGLGYDKIVFDSGNGLSLEFEIWSRRDGADPGFLLEVYIGNCYMIAAFDIVDVLDLLTRWAPAIQAVRVYEAINSILNCSDYEKYSLIPRLGALFKYGMKNASSWERENWERKNR